MRNIFVKLTKSPPPVAVPPSTSSWLGYPVEIIWKAKAGLTQKVSILIVGLLGLALTYWFKSKSTNLDPKRVDPPKKETSTEQPTTKSPSPTQTAAPPSTPEPVKEIPPFERNGISAKLKESPEHKCIIIDQFIIPPQTRFKTKIEFCRDLIIHAYLLSEKSGFKGELQIVAQSRETIYLLRYLNCIVTKEREKQSLLKKFAELTGVAPIHTPQTSEGEALTFYLDPQSRLAEACKGNLVVNEALNMKELYSALYEDAKDAVRRMDSFKPKEITSIPKSYMVVDGKVYLFELSYEIAPDKSSITLQNVILEDPEDMDLRAQALCYAKALWMFMRIPETSKRKIPLNIEQKVVALFPEQAQIYSLLGWVPAQHHKGLSGQYQNLLEAVKKVRKEADKRAEETLKKIPEGFTAEVHKIIGPIWKKIQSKKDLFEFLKLPEFKHLDLPLQVQIFALFRLVVHCAAGFCFEKTSETQIAYRRDLEKTIASLKYPQLFVPLTDQEKNLWTESGDDFPGILLERVESLLHQDSLYREKSTPFIKGSYSGHIEENIEGIIIKEITISTDEKELKPKLEFLHDLIIHAYILSYQKGFEGKLQIKAKAPSEIQGLLQCLDCKFEKDQQIFCLDSKSLLSKACKLNWLSKTDALKVKASEELEKLYPALYDTAIKAIEELQKKLKK